jgi:glycosyltransferase involved in cell wall biosynthesis
MISVVIPVFNAASSLPLQLESLRNQLFDGEWEIVLADNGSEDALEDVLANALAGFPVPVRVIDASGAPGAGFAREVGIRFARYDKIAFCDADDAVSPGWLSALERELETSPIAVGPVARVPYKFPYRYSGVSAFEYANYSKGPQMYGGIAVAPSNNCAYRREALSWGFSSDYLIGEDIATSLRCARMGYCVSWSGDARILYRDRPKGRESFFRAAATGVGAVMLAREFGTPEGVRTTTHVGKRLALVIALSPSALLGGARLTRWKRICAFAVGELVEKVLPGYWFGRMRRSRALSREGLTFNGRFGQGS